MYHPQTMMQHSHRSMFPVAFVVLLCMAPAFQSVLADPAANFPPTLHPQDDFLPICAQSVVGSSSNIPAYANAPTKFNGVFAPADFTLQQRSGIIIGPCDPDIDLSKHNLVGMVNVSGTQFSNPNVEGGFLEMWDGPITCPDEGCPWAEYVLGAPEAGPSLAHFAQAGARDPRVRLVSIIPDNYGTDANHAGGNSKLQDRYWTAALLRDILFASGIHINRFARFIVSQSLGGPAALVILLGSTSLDLPLNTSLPRPLLHITLDNAAAEVYNRGPNFGGVTDYNVPTLSLTSQIRSSAIGTELVRMLNTDVTHNYYLTYQLLNHPHMAPGQYAFYIITGGLSTAPADLQQPYSGRVVAYAIRYLLQAFINGVGHALGVPGTEALMKREKLQGMCTRSPEEIASSNIGTFTRACGVQLKPGGICPLCNKVVLAINAVVDTSSLSYVYGIENQNYYITYSGFSWKPTDNDAEFCSNPTLFAMQQPNAWFCITTLNGNETIFECPDDVDEHMTKFGPNVLPQYCPYAST